MLNKLHVKSMLLVVALLLLSSSKTIQGLAPFQKFWQPFAALTPKIGFRWKQMPNPTNLKGFHSYSGNNQSDYKSENRSNRDTRFDNNTKDPFFENKNWKNAEMNENFETAKLAAKMAEDLAKEYKTIKRFKRIVKYFFEKKEKEKKARAARIQKLKVALWLKYNLNKKPTNFSLINAQQAIIDNQN